MRHVAEQGFLTTRQATGLGYSRHVIARLVASGTLVHPLRGVYLQACDRRPEELHALVTRGVLADDPFAYATRGSALALIGSPLYRVPLAPVHIADPRRSSRVHDRVHRHVHRDGDAVTSREGFRLQSPALAAVFLAAAHGPGAGIVAMDWLLREQVCSPDDLGEVLQSGRVRRGLVAARFAVTHADGRSQSPGESLLRGVLQLSGFPFRPQVEIGGPAGVYIVDFLVEDRVVVEFDGDTKYGGDRGQSELVHEKRREDALRELGYEVVRVVWRELKDTADVTRRVREAVIRARARRFGA